MQRKWCCGCTCVVQKWIRAVSESTKRRARSDITLTVGPGDATLLCFYNLKTSFKFVFVFNNSSSGFVRTEWLKQLIPKKLIQTSFFFMGSTYFRWWIMEVGWWVMETNKSKQLWEFSLIPQSERVLWCLYRNGFLTPSSSILSIYWSHGIMKMQCN